MPQDLGQAATEPKLPDPNEERLVLKGREFWSVCPEHPAGFANFLLLYMEMQLFLKEPVLKTPLIRCVVPEPGGLISVFPQFPFRDL